MEDNVIIKINQVLGTNSNLEEVKVYVNELIKIYSYLVFTRYKDGEFIGYTIQYNISQNDDYNTLKSEDVYNQICEIINCDKNRENNRYIIGYNQPDISLMINLYDPLIKKLAKHQCEKWKQLDYDDLCQDCRMIILDLYNKGYYIHKTLVEKSFNNMVLMEMRKYRDAPMIVSLDDTVNETDCDDKSISLRDTIQDNNIENCREDKEIENARLQMFNEIKKLIIDEIGERRFEQLMRSYKDKTTDDWSRATMHKLKGKFMSMGIYEKLLKRYM